MRTATTEGFPRDGTCSARLNRGLDERIPSPRRHAVPMVSERRLPVVEGANRGVLPDSRRDAAAAVGRGHRVRAPSSWFRGRGDLVAPGDGAELAGCQDAGGAGDLRCGAGKATFWRCAGVWLH